MRKILLYVLAGLFFAGACSAVEVHHRVFVYEILGAVNDTACVGADLTFNVSDRSLGTPLKDVSVDVYFSNKKVFESDTDANGSIVFTPEKPGVYDLRLSRSRYTTEYDTLKVESCIMETTSSTSTTTSSSTTSSSTTTVFTSTSSTSSTTSTIKATTTSTLTTADTTTKIVYGLTSSTTISPIKSDKDSGTTTVLIAVALVFAALLLITLARRDPMKKERSGLGGEPKELSKKTGKTSLGEA